jgi:hypothetical protein
MEQGRPKSLSQADRRPSAMKQYSTAKRSYYIINGISLYRMIAVPLLIYLALTINSVASSGCWRLVFYRRDRCYLAPVTG